MTRNISFAMTVDQIVKRKKDVTRRFGWSFLKPGDRLTGVKKTMGLKKGETVQRLCDIEVVSVRLEPLNTITQDDVRREGFPDWTPNQFVQMLVNHYRIDSSEMCNRIEFKYV